MRILLNKRTGTVLLLLGLVYVAGSGWVPGLNTSMGTYLVVPLLWCLVILAISLGPRPAPRAKRTVRMTLVQAGLTAGLFQVLLYAVGGFFSTFGKSPTSFAPLSVIQNLFLVTTTLVGTELSRAFIVGSIFKKHTVLALGVTTITFFVMAIPLGYLTGVGPPVDTIRLLNTEIIPTFAENLFATMLALSGGPLASLAYRGFLQAFWWFCPVLPDLPWAMKGLIGAAVPLLGMGLTQNAISERPHERRKPSKQSSPAGWIATSVFSVALIWFAVGLFPIRPSLIGSGSMRPEMEVGDIAIVAKVPIDKIKVGDVILFKVEKGVTVIHRVIEISGDGGKSFVTKGDANGAPDADEVIPENVIGKAIFTAPKVGWPAAFLKNLFAE